MKISFIYLSFLFVCLSTAMGQSENEMKWPAKPIKVIVPFGAGGGSDTFARQLIRVIENEKYLSQPLVVINVGGAGGSIGSRRVKNARPDGYTMLMLHEGMLTAKHAARAAYGPEAFEAVAGTGKIGVVITVKEDSPFQTMSDLMSHGLEKPNTLNFAANLGAPSHFIGLLIEKSQPGTLFNYVQYGGGADRYGAIIGDHVQTSIFSIEEYLRYKDGGLRALAVFSPERHPALPELPSATEQGFEVDSSNMHFWWMPKGTPQSIQDHMAEAIRKGMQSKPMKEFMKTSWTEPVMLSGEGLNHEIQTRESRIEKVSLREIEVLPKFELWMISMVVILSLFYVVRMARDSDFRLAEKVWNASSVKISLLSLVYVFILSQKVLSFPILTTFFIFIIGMLISPNPKKSMGPLAIYSGLIAFGLFYLFTKVLVVDLPG